MQKPEQKINTIEINQKIMLPKHEFNGRKKNRQESFS